MRKNSSFNSYDNTFDTEPAPSNVEPKTQLGLATGRVCNSKYVNLRKIPRANGPVIGVLEFGDEAQILEKQPGFYHIVTTKGRKTGYIAEHYFKED